MSNLVPSLVPLDNGLNLQTAKIVAPPGSVLDALNYEQVDFQGQKRIDGFVRYDGSTLSAIDDYYKVTLTGTYTGEVGDLINTDEGLFGVVAGISSTIVYLVVINENFIPEAGDSIYTVTDGESGDEYTVSSIVSGVESGASVSDHYANLLLFSAALRNRVEELPGSIIGLHWFRDRLYAVADVVVMSLDDVTPVIYPNDELTAGDQTAKVLDSFVRGASRLLFLNTMTEAPWTTEGTAITRGGDPVGSVAAGYETIELDEEVASFFESRNELQVLAEDGPSGPFDFGWRFIDQGWEVNFENGLSLYGSLPSLNQNIVGLGTQGPTNTSGNNGLPLILTQSVNITNKPAQVNGWKSSQSPENYELETDNLVDIDDDTIYADAYISWDGTTGVVSAPGYTDDTLIEYPATNTVVVDIP